MFERAKPAEAPALQVRERTAGQKLQEVFGETTCLARTGIRTLLLLVMRNATTDSPWPLSNNPYAKYNDLNRPDSNLKFPLWQLVRASTAAPTFFPAGSDHPARPGSEQGKEFVFVDGGVTMYNNPAFQMFLMATLDRYWPKAPQGQQGLGDGCGQDADRLGRHRHESERPQGARFRAR